jgi:PAS domain S-box
MSERGSRSSGLPFFLTIFLRMTVIIAVMDWVTRGLAARFPDGAFSSPFALESLIESGSLTVLSAPLIWYVCIRPMQVRIRRDREKIERESRSQAKLRQAVEACQDMILITDERGRIRYANPSLCQFSGYQEEDLVGLSPAVLDSPHCDQAVVAEMNEALKSGKPWAGRILGRRYGPKSFPVPIEGQLDKPDELVGSPGTELEFAL